MRQVGPQTPEAPYTPGEPRLPYHASSRWANTVYRYVYIHTSYIHSSNHVYRVPRVPEYRIQAMVGGVHTLTLPSVGRSHEGVDLLH